MKPLEKMRALAQTILDTVDDMIDMADAITLADERVNFVEHLTDIRVHVDLLNLDPEAYR